LATRSRRRSDSLRPSSCQVMAARASVETDVRKLLACGLLSPPYRGECAPVADGGGEGAGDRDVAFGRVDGSLAKDAAVGDGDHVRESRTVPARSREGNRPS
jgi:hypothetical protein